MTKEEMFKEMEKNGPGVGTERSTYCFRKKK